jgi:cation diffusion facilitator CzcD-associated flavoprotein CzcO
MSAEIAAGEVAIAIIGTGFSGLGMGIRLKQAGIHDFVIFEQADHVGGTWRDNHYPGAACDIESHLYSLSFAPNPNWTRQYAPQAEILAYLDHCADKYGLRPHIRLCAAVTSAVFDEPSGHWELRTSDGKITKAHQIIAACGGISRPALPDIPGLEDFAGKIFHSARWDHSYDLTDKTVAVIGTGASAIQIIPAIAPRVKRLHLFQRTPPWIVPKADRRITEAERERFRRRPVLQHLVRWKQYLRHELFAAGFVSNPGILRLAERLVHRYLRQMVPDPALRAKLIPDYRMGCKRVLVSNDYYPALQRPNVDLITQSIKEVQPHGLLTQDGTSHPVDAIILATGFQAAEAMAPFSVLGRSGRDLNAAWRDGAEAYLGTTVTGFPNLFFIVGPNTGLGHNSMIFMIESQIAYVLSCIKTMRSRRLKWVEVRPETQAQFNRTLQARFPRTVWKTGCVSWYQTRAGKNTTLWPGYTFEYRLKTRRFDPSNYDLSPK